MADNPFAARLAEMDKEEAAPADNPFAARLAEMDAESDKMPKQTGKRFIEPPDEGAAPAPPTVATTKLSAKDEQAYQAWKRTLPKGLQYEGDYDLRGFYQENPTFNVNTPGQHMTDKFKLPNHDTFSDESKYYNNATKAFGGHWEDRPGGGAIFVPNDPAKKGRIEEDAAGNRVSAQSPTAGGPTFDDQAAQIQQARAALGPKIEPGPLGLVKQAARESGQAFVNLGHQLASANDFAARAMVHPVDTFGGGKAPAVGREFMRGVNANIPFANRAVEAIGGPAAESPEDAAMAPGAQAAGSVAGLPVGNMVGGIAAKGLEAAVPVIAAAPGAVRSGIRAADEAVGNKAVELATRPGLKESLVKTGKAVGGTVGGVAGTVKAGPLGTYVGVKGGVHAGEKMGEAAYKALEIAARRRMAQEAAAKMAAARAELAQVAELPAAGSELSARVARSMANTVGTEAERIAPRRVPRATGFTENPPPVPARQAPPVPPATPPEPPVRAAPPARRLQITDENGRDLIANPPTPAESLRADVRRDVQRFRNQPSPDVDPASQPPHPDISGQLDQSLQVLNLMKQAKDAGTLTPALVRSAVNLGMPAQAVLKIAGPDLFKAAMKPAAKMTPGDLGL